MGNVKDLDRQEAIEKMKELAEDINVCLFCTVSEEQLFETRPMGTQRVDEEGNFWFLSDRQSHKNYEIKHNDKVQLIYSKPADAQFMSVYGKASISQDRQLIDKLWNPLVKAWFKEGKDDPQLTVICVKPEKAYYWDTKNGKMVSLLAIAVSAISSKEFDNGREGELRI
ncbi:MAG TPA: pyridoxamine 5'-phosphate oxidase family protein [Bacteroidia bacterium]|jgi:general stress protein 26